MVIKDHNGKVPNFIIKNGEMIHQPTGLKVAIVKPTDDRRNMQEAHVKLKEMVNGTI